MSMRRRVMSLTAMVLLASCLMCMTGCMGTAATRFIENGEGDWAGEYPFKAVVWDIEAIAKGDWRGSPHGVGPESVWGTIALPWDIVSDALLLPFNLILWPFGFRRRGPH